MTSAPRSRRFETLAYGDLSVLVKVGVQFGLFGGAILQLGTKRHHDAYLADLVTGQLMGCFAMTESGHGSNVQALGTVATLRRRDAGVRDHDDHARRRARTTSATPPSTPSWPSCSPSSRSAGSSEGVHAFVVPIRDRTARPCPASGSRTTACKMGLNGVDNGRMWFDDVRRAARPRCSTASPT